MMTAVEKEFVITHVFKNVSSMKIGDYQWSPIEEHFGVPWSIWVRRKEDYLVLFLMCKQEMKDKEWTIEIWSKMSVKAVDGKTHSFEFDVTFESTDDFDSTGWAEFIKWEDLIKDCVVDDTLTAEIHVKIKKMTGINLRNFDESTKQFSDVVLVVEDQKFYVSKLYLASQSPYFEALFLRNFKESTLSEIPLQDVNANDLQNFLEILYGEYPTDDSTIEGIVHLANMYDAKLTIQKCEQFLLTHSEKSLKEKLQLAYRYQLKSLKHHCLSKITTTEDIRSVMAHDMDPSVVAELLQKSLDLNGK